MRSEIEQNKSSTDQTMERLALEFGGDTYRCAPRVCSTESTALGRSRLLRLIDQLANSAKAAKKQAIISCKTPTRNSNQNDPRWNTDDYKKEVVSAIRDLPKNLTRCP